MKKVNEKLGFTLIELLVVITIIGILATGAVSVYTSQIQKARDSTRITDVTALKTGVEQYYQDFDQYPDSQNGGALGFSGVTAYVPKLPKDPKSGQASSTSAFDYIYTVGPDSNSILGQDFEVSTTFEQSGNMDKKAANTGDGGGDDDRLELGIDLAGNDTDVSALITADTLECVAAGGGAATTCTAAATRLVIKGN